MERSNGQSFAPIAHRNAGRLDKVAEPDPVGRGFNKIVWNNFERTFSAGPKDRGQDSPSNPSVESSSSQSFAPIAQLDRVAGSDPVGRGFKSS